jgi:hypothetical protein
LYPLSIPDFSLIVIIIVVLLSCFFLEIMLNTILGTLVKHIKNKNKRQN